MDDINLLLIGVDSLRADHMSCYGYHRLTTPHIDRLASGGVLFEEAFSPHIPTVPGYTSMLTGTDVISNQAVSLAPRDPLDTSIKLLPEILGETGYRSACVGFDGSFFRGFDEYRTYDYWPSWEDAPGHKAEELNRMAIPLLEDMAQGPFFLFLRHMDPHTPYLPPPPFRDLFYSRDPVDGDNSMEPVFARNSFADYFRSWMPPGIRDIDWVVAQYDSSLAYMDACISRILTRLEELGLLENTLVVITSDHGESLAEHGIYFDHHGLYEQTIHIPLILHLPGAIPGGSRFSETVLQQDLLPTLLDVMGTGEAIKKLHIDGKSMLPIIEGVEHWTRDEIYLSECTWMKKQGWRTSRFKLIQALEPDLYGFPPWELYDLTGDPGERNNIADDKPGIVKSLRERMESWKSRRMAESGKPDPLEKNRPSFKASGYRMRALTSRKPPAEGK